MNIEDYVSYEVAKLLKEKGFDESCDYYYDQSSDEPQQLTLDEMYYSYDEFLKAPTLQMAMRWLRKIYGIDIVIEISDPSDRDRKYYCVIWNKNNDSYILDLFGSYEEAVSAAIEYSLKNLI